MGVMNITRGTLLIEYKPEGAKRELNPKLLTHLEREKAFNERRGFKVSDRSQIGGRREQETKALQLMEKRVHERRGERGKGGSETSRGDGGGGGDTTAVRVSQSALSGGKTAGKTSGETSGKTSGETSG